MSASPKQKRLENIEVLLTPRQWAIRLADEMRLHGPNGVHPETLVTDDSPVSLNSGPAYRLVKHADEHGSASKPEDLQVRIQLSPKFQTEYLGMKALILKVNEAVKEKTVSLRLKVALELCTLYKLILDDGLGQPANDNAALAREQNTDDVDPDGENEFILDEAAIYGDDVSPEPPGNGLSPRPKSAFESNSLIKNWVADSTLLIKTVFAHKAAAQAIREKYFDGHSILFEDVEAELDETTKAMEDLSAIFEEYITIRGKKIQTELSQEIHGGQEATAGERLDPLSMDIQAIRASVGPNLVDPLVNEWVEYAKNQAATAIPNESEEPGEQFPESAARESQTCEIPITVQGSRNTRTPQPFLEETFTAIVFPNGAVLRLLEVVTHGQIVIIQNMRLKQEAACRVVSFKPSTSVEGNVEVEFIQPAPDFWGITFTVEISRSPREAPVKTALSPSVPIQQAEPKAAAAPAPMSWIEPKRSPEPIQKAVIPAARDLEIPKPPLPRVTPVLPEAIVKPPEKPAALAPPVGAPSIAPVPTRTADDSLALYKAMVELYAVPAPAAEAAPAPPIAPAIAKVPPPKHESPSGRDRSNVDTLDRSHTRIEVQKERRSPEPVRRTVPPVNLGLVPSKTGLIETLTQKLSKAARALQTRESRPSISGLLISEGRAPATRREKLVLTGAIGAVVLSVVGVYLWRVYSTPASSQAAAQIASAVAPNSSAGVITQGSPSGANGQTVSQGTNALQTPSRQKKSTPRGNGTGNVSKNRPTQDSTNGGLPRTTNGHPQIEAPINPSTVDNGTNTNNAITATETNTQGASNGAGELNTTPGPATSEQSFVGPRVLSTVLPPEYPRMALQRGDEGEVLVTAKINKSGIVTGTKVVSGPQTLQLAAANWVTQWRFEPAKLNGKPTEASVTVKVFFRKP